MGGGLIGIISYGCSDLFLTGAPQITFFKIVYRRYTNFSIESVRINFDQNLEFGQETEIMLPRTGDCISKTYLEINLPQISITSNDSGSDTSNGANNSKTDIQNYNAVLNFMSANAGGYRLALSDYNTENTSASMMISNLYNYFNNKFTTSFNDYIKLVASLVSTNSGKPPIFYGVTGPTAGELPGLSVTDCQFSSLYGVAHYFNKSTGSSFTKDQFMSAINTSQRITQRITQTYFDKYMATYQTKLLQTINPNFKTLNFAWVKKLGHAIIDYVDIYIGGEKIDRHYGQFMDIWHDLTNNTNTEYTYMKMIGNVPELTTFNQVPKPAYKLVIPLQFWFTKKVGLSLPVVAMEYSNVTIKIKLNDLQKVAYLEQDATTELSLLNIWENKGYILNCNLLVDYIYLDALERKKFAQAAHEYLIEVVESIELTDIDKNNLKIKLDLNHPSKELIWVFQKQAYVNIGNGIYASYPSIYSLNPNGTGNIMETCQIDFMGNTRVSSRIGNSIFYNYLQPYAHHTCSSTGGIYNYCFANNPEEHQPSCTCNFSRMGNATMTIKLNANAFTYNLSDIIPNFIGEDEINNTLVDLSIYSKKYNVLRIIGGFGGMAFT